MPIISMGYEEEGDENHRIYLPFVVYNDTATEPKGRTLQGVRWLGLYTRVFPANVAYHHHRCDCQACQVWEYYYSGKDFT